MEERVILIQCYMCILLFFQISEEARPQFVQYGNIQNRTLWSFIGQYLLGFLQYQ